jgi:hypothetical protein
MNVRWLAPALVFLAGCSSVDVVHLELGGLSFERGFLVLLNEAGQPKEVSRVFGTSAGGVSFGQLPAVSAENDDRAYLLTFEVGALRESVLYYDESREADLSAETVEPPSTPIYLAQREAFQTRFLDSTRIFGFSEAGAVHEETARELLEKVSLVVPTAPESCASGKFAPMEAFGARADFELTPQQEMAATYSNFRHARLVDEDRALGVSSFGIYFLKKGERFEATPAGYLQRGSALFSETVTATGALSPVEFYELAVERNARPDGTWRVWVAAADRSDGFGAYLFELVVYEDGIEVAGPPRNLPVQPLGIAIDPQGNLGIRTNLDAFFVIAPDGALSMLPPVPNAGGIHAIAGIATGDPEYPWLLAGIAVVHLYDRRAQRWQTTSILGGNGEKLPLDALAAARTAEGELELWAMGDGGLVVRKRGEGLWENARLLLPPRYTPCAANGTYPNLNFTAHMDQAIAIEDYVYITVRSCDVVLEVRRSDACVSLLTSTLRPIEGTGGLDLQTLDYRGGALLIGGEKRRLLKAEPR